jgi:uncharacterized membrane protein
VLYQLSYGHRDGESRNTYPLAPGFQGPSPDSLSGTPMPHHVLDPRRAMGRVGLSGVAGLAAYLAFASRLPGPTARLIGWDTAGLTLLALAWSLFTSADAAETRSRAGEEDPGRTLVYVIVVLTSSVSLLAATILSATAHDLETGPKHLLTGLCLFAVVLAWALTHTAFTFRYAHLYYREDAEGVGGILLPGEQPPTYFDFAYFAFTVGMCFQVSDVTVTSSQIRRAVLLHAVISFAYNSVILAFVLNLVFSAA